MESIVQLISDLGFPIGCCIVLFMQNNKFSQALNENTAVLNKLVERLDRVFDNDK